MKLLFVLLLPCLWLPAAEPDRATSTLILDETAIANLQLEFAEADETTFEETVFALGHLDVLPGKRAIVSSRIPGRAFSVLALPHQSVEEGDEVAWIESRQPGDPPPTIPLTAPISGLISRIDLAVGQPVSPDQTLMEILDLTSVEASAQVPQHLAGRLALGQTARIRLPAFPDERFEATLAHLAPIANATNGTLEAAFHLPNPDLRLRPGMRAEFSIVVSTRHDVMTIPRQAVQGDALNRFVFIKDYELPNAFVKVPVVLGAQNDASIEVLQGLLPGDEVVTRGAYSLAFAGQGSVSLREAMDAAHGHPHNDDGSEMTPEQLAAQETDHGHDHPTTSPTWNLLTTFFAATTGLLLALLLFTSLRRPHSEPT
jgi:cobalt-zinc-cadmium efflux system membrane fusion protein